MAKIVESLTRAEPEYSQTNIQSLVRDLDSVITKLTSASTPTVTVVNNSITAIKSAALTADTTKELLTQPLIVEGGTTLTIQSSNTGSFDFAVSYLNMLKEKVD